MPAVQEEFYEYRGMRIRPEMLAALRRYTERHVPVGSFLTAVLHNDLMEACGRADDENQAALPAYCAWLYNEAPPGCFGSRAKVEAWLAQRKIVEEQGDAAQPPDEPGAGSRVAGA